MRSLSQHQLTHRGESVEITGDVSHDTTFVWMVRVTQVLDLEQLLQRDLKW